MRKKARDMSVFEQIQSGLEDGVAYFRGDLTLVTIGGSGPIDCQDGGATGGGLGVPRADG